MVRDLIGTVEKDKTEMGILITRVEPTKGMLETAASAGFYHWSFSDRDYPKVQIVTVQDLLDGKRPDMPIEHGTLTPAPKIEDTGVQLKTRLLDIKLTHHRCPDGESCPCGQGRWSHATCRGCDRWWTSPPEFQQERLGTSYGEEVVHVAEQRQRVREVI